MVVRTTVRMRQHTPRDRWSLPGVSVLLAGFTILPIHPESISTLLPGLGLHAIEQLGGGWQERAVAPTTYGSFASPIGSPDPALSSALGWSGGGLTTEASDPAVAALLGAAMWAGEDPTAVSADGPETSEGVVRNGIHPVCTDSQTAIRMQDASEFRTGQAVRGAPAQFPAGVLAEHPPPVATIPDQGDPTLGPGGHPTNLPPPGPAGAWCPPGPLPFADSSPLASRAVWTPIFVLLIGFLVFWLSRGVGLSALTRSIQ
ncbi:MAG TPA: hypothetical protein VJY39_02035 [Acidisphaera sp.]|nr:hypothetical protein [Acidisphaera sp.]